MTCPHLYLPHPDRELARSGAASSASTSAGVGNSMTGLVVRLGGIARTQVMVGACSG